MCACFPVRHTVGKTFLLMIDLIDVYGDFLDFAFITKKSSATPHAQAH